VPRDDGGPATSVVRAYLAARLAAAAVPASFVTVARLPLTLNGKVDRAALPPPSWVRPDLGTEFVAPRTGLERAIAAMWAEVLQLDEIGVHDNFFDLGGDSLGLSRVHGRLQDLIGAEFSIVALYEHLTIDARWPGTSTVNSPAAAPTRRRASAAPAARR
jgi:aryl carrier-like protein